MELIYPLHEERINMFCGMPVCIVTTQGTRHVGILTHCKGGKITLNADPREQQPLTGPVVEAASETAAVSKKDKKKKKAKKEQAPADNNEKVQTQAYPYDPYMPYYRPYNPFGEVFAIELALIAFLFLIL